MPGSLDHSPADVLRRVLIALGVGTDPALGGSWPIFAAGEPDKPDSAITVYDTTGTQQGRTHTDGEVQEHHGVQVRIRAASHSAGYAKARDVATALDRDLYQEIATLGAARYMIHAATRTSDVLTLGRESPTSKRTLFTLNAVLSVRQTN